MIIRNITIENFQSYYESQTIEFSKGLNLIIGNGGKGKSKLFNAFYWVLFGKIYITGIGWCTTDNLPQSAKFAMQRYEFINKRALFKAQINDKIRASVQIEIEFDKVNDYIIERSVSALRLEGEEWDSNDAWQVGGNMLKVSFDSTTGTKVLNDLLAEDKINELFPDGIRNYIWFQGESLESLINFRNKETLKAAVKHISYFPYYEKLSEIISKSKLKITGIESRKLKEVNKYNSSVKGLLSTIDNLNYKISREEENKKQFETHIETIKIALADGETKISGLASYSMLVKKYKDCENEINKLLSETTRIDEFQREKLPSLWVLRGIEPMIQQCKEIIMSAQFERGLSPCEGTRIGRWKGIIPPPFIVPLPDLLDEYYCIDGLPIDRSPLFKGDITQKPIYKDEKHNDFLKDVNRYIDRDPRMGFTIMTHRTPWIKGEIIENGQTLYDAKNYTLTRCHFRKWIEETDLNMDDMPQDVYTLRYADILLMRAEALVRSGVYDYDEVLGLINQVRQRPSVMMPKVENVEGKEKVLNSDELFCIIKHERRIELAYEGHRYYDLIRWKELKHAWGEIFVPVNLRYYLGDKSLVWPLPEKEIEINNLLEQNPLWK